MMPAGRRVHLVGGLPGATTEAAMRAAVGSVGHVLDRLPDGETGVRRGYVAPIIESLRDHPDLVLHTDGDWSSLDCRPIFRVRRGHRMNPDLIRLGYAECFERAVPAFEQMRRELGRADLAFQVGVPSGIVLAFIAFGPRGLVRATPVFTEATVREIRRISATAQQCRIDVVFQIEAAAEMALAVKAGPLAPLVVSRLARGATVLARRSPPGTRFGVHLCLGDLNHQTDLRMRDCLPIVRLVNALAADWPDKRSLEFVHVPLAAAAEAPSLDGTFYAPLSRLKLPLATRLVSGFVHERLTADEHRRLLDLIELQAGRQTDVSSSCGLGRCTPDEARRNLQQAAALCAA